MRIQIIISHVVGACLRHFRLVRRRPRVIFYRRPWATGGFCGFEFFGILDIGFGVFLSKRFVVIWKTGPGFERWDID
jgi:hypothetical protein